MLDDFRLTSDYPNTVGNWVECLVPVYRWFQNGGQTRGKRCLRSQVNIGLLSSENVTQRCSRFLKEDLSYSRPVRSIY